MKIARTLLAASLLACVPATLLARDARDTTRIVKALAMQGSNQKVIEAIRVLEQEGFLQQMSDALSEGAASATAQPASVESGSDRSPAAEVSGAQATEAAASEAPAAPGASEDQIVQVAFEAAKPTIAKHLGNPNVKVGQKWVRETTRGGRAIFEVKIMPESLGIVSFFTTYTIDVDKQTMKVTRIK